MIHHVWDRCQLAERLDEVYVLTNDERIQNYCIENDINCKMVTKKCDTGTDRCTWAIKDIDTEVFVNIQGDEPMIEPETINAVVDALKEGAEISNTYCQITNDDVKNDRNVVKATVNYFKNAIYFSRFPISDYQQMGLYAFKKNMLNLFGKMERRPQEVFENVEMLQFVEHGFKVRMVRVDENSVSVDTPEDLKKVEEMI